MALKQLIGASAPSISAQTDRPPVTPVLFDAHFRCQSSALLLQTDRALVHQRMHRPASPASQETVYSTSRARDRRA